MFVFSYRNFFRRSHGPKRVSRGFLKKASHALRDHIVPCLVLPNLSSRICFALGLFGENFGVCSLILGENLVAYLTGFLTWDRGFSKILFGAYLRIWNCW